jgi:protein TonB
MFDELVESRPQRQRSIAQGAASIAAHTVLIAISIQLTRAAAATIAKAPPETEMRLARAPGPKVPRPGTTAAAASALTAAPAVVAMPAPISIPISIPAVALTRGFDPTRIGQTGDAQGIPTGVADQGTEDSRAVATLPEVDEAARYLDGPTPRYPPALRQAGIEGSVQLQYIVGVDGAVEPGSISVLRSTNMSFEAPAIDAIIAAHFRPARIKGHKVRQLVEQMVRFTIH